MKLSPLSMAQRVRVRLARGGPAIFLSHIQQIKSLRQALHASSWPVALSQGKRPNVKASFGPAIAVGYGSEAEYMDVDLSGRLDIPAGGRSLQDHLPDGYDLKSLKRIPRFFPSLEESVSGIGYEVRSSLLDGTKDRWDAFWASDRFPVIKKKADREEIIDARHCVKEWNLTGQTLTLELRVAPKRTLKPERIIQAVCGFTDDQVAMNPPHSLLSIKRTKLWLEKSNGDCIEI